MGVTRGPKYSGPQDGLIFSFDPKNRQCWTGGTDVTSIINNNSMTGSIYNSSNPMKTEGALTTAGYFEDDGTNDYINIANVGGQLSGASYCTVEYWANLDSYHAKGIFGINKVGATANQNNIDCNFYSNAVRWNVRNNSTNYAYLTLNTIVSTGNWFQYVGTFDGTQIGNDKALCYINGIKRTLTYDGTLPSTLVDFNSSDYFTIGRGGNLTWFMDGKVAIVNVWNRTLSAAEILTQYNRLKGRFGL
jgi:hypothetical protein